MNEDKTLEKNKKSSDIFFNDVLRSINAYLYDTAVNSNGLFGYPLNAIGQCEDSAEYLKRVLPLYIDGQIESLRAVLGSPNEEDRKRLRQKFSRNNQ